MEYHRYPGITLSIKDLINVTGSGYMASPWNYKFLRLTRGSIRSSIERTTQYTSPFRRDTNVAFLSWNRILETEGTGDGIGTICDIRLLSLQSNREKPRRIPVKDLKKFPSLLADHFSSIIQVSLDKYSSNIHPNEFFQEFEGIKCIADFGIIDCLSWNSAVL